MIYRLEGLLNAKLIQVQVSSSASMTPETIVNELQTLFRKDLGKEIAGLQAINILEGNYKGVIATDDLPADTVIISIAHNGSGFTPNGWITASEARSTGTQAPGPEVIAVAPLR